MYGCGDHLFRLGSFRAHLVLFSVQKSVVTEAIVSLNDLSFSKSHSNCQKMLKGAFVNVILCLILVNTSQYEVRFIQELSKTTLSCSVTSLCNETVIEFVFIFPLFSISERAKSEYFTYIAFGCN